MLNKINKHKRGIIFWVIYICYALIYQKVAYPDEETVWYADVLHFGSYIILFCWIYLAANLFFKYEKKVNFRIISIIGASQLSFWIVQFIKNYCVFELFEGMLPYYILLIPEIFLITAFAVIFSLIEFTDQVNLELMVQLIAKNQKEILLNKNRIDKEIMIETLDDLVRLATKGKKLNELKEFRDLMDFLLNSTHKSLISINLEIENLYRYLHLMKIRTGHTDIFQIEIIGEKSDWSIPHKAILTLIENTVKHGDLGEKVFIKIGFLPNSLKISVKNKISYKPTIIESTNIGLSNLRARLKLHLKGRHEFNVIKVEDYFEVKLCLT